MNPRHPIPCVMSVVICALTAFAQSTTATLTGTITDPNGAVVVGAKVTVTDTRTGVAKTVTTNSEGVYFAPALQPGEYTVAAEARGFQKFTKNGVRLEISQTAEVNFQLSVSGAEQVVEVGSASILLQTEQPSLEQTIEQKLVESLPLADQNVMQLVMIAPGVVSGNPGNPAPIGLIGNRGFFDSNFSPNDPKGPTNPNGPDQVDSTRFTLGNTSRTLDSVRRDNYINLDFALWKSFRLTERWKFEFRGEFFNAMNYVVFGTPVTNINDSQFGRVTTQLNTPRRIQLAGRIVF